MLLRDIEAHSQACGLCKARFFFLNFGGGLHANGQKPPLYEIFISLLLLILV